MIIISKKYMQIQVNKALQFELLIYNKKNMIQPINAFFFFKCSSQNLSADLMCSMINRISKYS